MIKPFAQHLNLDNRRLFSPPATVAVQISEWPWIVCCEFPARPFPPRDTAPITFLHVDGTSNGDDLVIETGSLSQPCKARILAATIC